MKTINPRKLKRRHAVLVGTVPDSFIPETPVDLPCCLQEVDTLEGPMTRPAAVALLRVFNRQQLANGLDDRRWAILVYRPRKGGGV